MNDAVNKIEYIQALESALTMQAKLVRAMNLLHKCKKALRSSGWDKYDADNPQRNGLYIQVLQITRSQIPELVMQEGQDAAATTQFPKVDLPLHQESTDPDARPWTHNEKAAGIFLLLTALMWGAGLAYMK